MTEARSDSEAPEQALMGVEDRRDERAVLLMVTGEIDISSSPQLWARVCEALPIAGTRPVLLDLTGVTFLGSHGLAVLSRAAEAARRDQISLRVIVGHGRPVRRSIELSGLDQLLSLFDTEAEALAG